MSRGHGRDDVGPARARRALAACARLAPLLETEPSLEALSFYPHLLAFELHRLPDDTKITPVILLDTFEDIADRHRDLERLLQRLVWLLPNCFFVISGRSRLQWADPALHGQLDHTGPAAWPGLAATPGPVPSPRHGMPGGRQHLIGDLSPEDCDDHLARRLVKDGRPLIIPAIRAVITARSHGLPLHLDPAASRFLEIRRTREPQPADFDHTFPALLARALSDLTAEERGLANLARLAGDFPTALAAVPTLGWEGRHHRVLGDIRWSHADTAAAVAAFEAGRAEAEQHGAAGERAMMQVRLALAVSFADPVRADDELALAHQLLDGLDQRSNTLLAQVVALIKDAGTDGVTDRARTLHTDIDNAGLPFLHRFVELALAFQHAVRGEDEDLAAVIDRLRALTATGDFAYFTDITHFMAGLPLPEPSTTRWTTSEDDVRSSWRGLVQARQEFLRAGN
ncbi:hypothetical protein [Streptomyces albus]|uniref:hypothetical protein n=1 Tax=Streptomyces albus TaxID=1888 RepID=UPI000689A60B|nr:hypothetical protein [Streptomyces albus]